MEKTLKKHGKGRTKTVFKYLFLAALILEMLFLSVEALLPGDASSQSSGAFGEAVDDIVTDFSGDGIRDVRPSEIFIEQGGKTVESLSLKRGTHTALTLGFSPSSVSVNYREAVWRSADEEIAEVNGGKLYAKGIGETVITASLAGVEEITAELSVKVTEVIADRLALTFADGSKKIGLETGDRALLLATLEPSTPDGTIVYESLDPQIAAVDGETVQAVGEGETSIRAIYTPMTDPDATLTAQVDVTVTARTRPSVKIEGLSIVPDDTPAIRYDGETTFLYAEDRGCFAARLSPADTTEDAIVWESSDDGVLFVDAAGEFTARAKGTATVTAVSACDRSIRAQCTLEVRNRSLGVKFGMRGAQVSPTDTENTYTLVLNAGSRDAALSLEREDDKELFIKYESSDRTIARFYGDGTLAALRSSSQAEGGIVLLTVTVADNGDLSNENGDLALTYTLLLTVNKQAFSESVDGWGLLVRKLFGHFGAFLAVGATAAAVAIFYDNGSWKRRLILLLALVVLGFTFACFTELLQTDLFTAGRAASFSDVIIDCSGYLPAALAVYGCFLLVMLVLFLVKRARGRKKKEEPAPPS